MDPVACVEYLGDLVFHAAAKDTRINPDHVRIVGVLDDRFERTPAGADQVNLGGRNTLNRWPARPAWEFVAVGRGHGVEEFWVPFLRALHAVDEDMAVNIEHEDQEFDQVEGLRMAAENLLAAAGRAGV
jgi:sugar phosphate isomerase/epimerase